MFKVTFSSAEPLTAKFGGDSIFEPKMSEVIYVPVGETYDGSYDITPTEETQTLATEGLLSAQDFVIEAIPSNYVGSAIERRTESDVSISGASVSVPDGYYAESESVSVQSGSATVQANLSADDSTVEVGTNKLTFKKSVSNTPIVSPGYVSEGTTGNTQIELSADIPTRSSSDLTANGATVSVPSGYYSADAKKSVASGSAGTPTASKGAVSNHSVDVTPSVTNTTGYIMGSTKTGTPVTVTASELVSGTKSITANDTGIDVTEYQYVDVSVSGGTDFIITLSWDDNEGVWMPDKSFAEIVSAYNDGKTLAAIVGEGEWADTFYYLDSMPDYFVYEVITNGQGVDYIFDSNGVTVDFEFSIISPNFDSPSRTYTPTESVQTETITYDPNDGFNGISEVDITVNAIPSSYVGSGVTRRDWQDVTFDTGEGSVEVPSGYYPSDAGRAMPTGTVNNPTATKGNVSNHAIAVTPSVSFSAGFVGSGSKSGSAVTVSASELVSGSQTLTSNDTYDVTNLASVVVNVSGGGGVTGVAKGTLTVQSNVNTSTNTKITDTATIGFTPKAFLFYRSDRSATNYHVNAASFITLGSSYYIGTRTRYSNNALSTSGNTTNWTTQSSGYLYFNSNNVYFRSSSSYILAAGTWNWVAIE